MAVNAYLFVDGIDVVFFIETRRDYCNVLHGKLKTKRRFRMKASRLRGTNMIAFAK